MKCMFYIHSWIINSFGRIEQSEQQFVKRKRRHENNSAWLYTCTLFYMQQFVLDMIIHEEKEHNGYVAGRVIIVYISAEPSITLWKHNTYNKLFREPVGVY